MKEKGKLKKRLNTLWKYGSLIAVVMVVLTILVVSISNAYSNKQQLVLNALNEYNSKVLGYQKTDNKSRKLALDRSVKLSIKSNSELLESIKSKSFNAELLEYFNLCLMRVESYQGSIEELSEKLTNAQIDAWIVSDINGVYYYGSLSDGTTSTPTVYNSSTESLDEFMSEFKGVLTDNKTVLITSDYFGVFLVTLEVCKSFNNAELNEEVDKLLAIIRIMKCGYPTNNLDTIMEYYDTIKNNE